MRGGETGVHRPLAIGRDEDQAARGRRRAGARWHIADDTGGAHVMDEHLAKLIVGHLADESATLAERGEPRQRVRCRTAANLLPGTHFAIEIGRLLGADQPHRAFLNANFREEFWRGTGDDVDDGIADGDDIGPIVAVGDDVGARVGHEGSVSRGKSRAL